MGGNLSNYESKAILSEHESAKSHESAPIGYEPTEEEQKAIKMVDNLFQKAKNYNY